MKRLFLISLLLLSFLAFAGLNSNLHAQQPELIMAIDEEEEVATKEAVLVVVEYQLPYPGILPDNPLYKLKMLRDRILDLLTTNQIKKANFYLLQGDKRLAASILLVEKGNEELSETTSSKALDYLEKSIKKTIEARDEGEGVDDIILQLIASSSKHREEIGKLKDQSSEEFSQRFRMQLQRAVRIEKAVKEIKP